MLGSTSATNARSAVRNSRSSWTAMFGASALHFRLRHGAVITLRLRPSRHSAYVPLFRSPNRKPKRDGTIARTRLKSPMKHHFLRHALLLTLLAHFAFDNYPMFGRFISVFHPRYIRLHFQDIYERKSSNSRCTGAFQGTGKQFQT